MIKLLIFIAIEIYTISYALFELKEGNRVSFVGILFPAIISAVLFLQYST